MATVETQILQAAVEAAYNATTDAGKLQNTLHEVGSLNEQWVQSYVSFAVNDTLREAYKASESNNFVTFETTAEWLEGFGARGSTGGRWPNNLTKRSRFDVVAWSKGGRVAGLIEIKDQPRMQRSTELRDPAKLCAAMKRWESLRWSIFLFSVRSTGSTRGDCSHAALRARAKDVVQRIRDEFPDNFVRPAYDECESDASAVVWAGVLFKPSR